jgi:hypothetical protein
MNGQTVSRVAGKTVDSIYLVDEALIVVVLSYLAKEGNILFNFC